MKDEREIPDGWRWVQFGDVVRHVKDRVDPETAGLDRYVAGEHMNTDDLRIRRWGTVGDGYLGPAFHMRFKPGHVLYGSRRTYLRKVAVADFEGITANTTFVVEPATDEMLREFLPLVMTTEAFHEHSVQQSKGSVNPYVNFRDLAWYQFALPPADEQRELVDLAFAADDASMAIDRSRTAADCLLAALLAELLASCSDTDMSLCADLADVQVGKKLSPDKRLGLRPKPTLRAVNLRLDGLDLTDVNEMDFTEHEDQALSVRAHDILLVEGGNRDSVGAPTWVAVTPEPRLFIQNTVVRLRVRDHSQIFPSFLYWVWRAMFAVGRFEQLAVGTKLYHLGPRRVGQVLVPVPSASVQQSWEQRLEAVQVLRESLSARANTATALRRGLLSHSLEAGIVQ